MANTARQIITASLRKLGVIASGETPSAEELQDGLSALQGMIDSWSTSDLLSYTETVETFSLVAGQQEYTIGSSGDFDTTRPVEIIGINLVDTGNLEIPMHRVQAHEWQAIGIKATTSSFPIQYYFRREWPLGRIFFWPVPTEVRSVIIYSRKPIITITDVNTEIDLPHGYSDAITYNLCPELVDEYGGQLTESIVALADRKLSAIKTQNLAKNIPFLATEGALQGGQQVSGASLSAILTGGG